MTTTMQVTKVRPALCARYWGDATQTEQALADVGAECEEFQFAEDVGSDTTLVIARTERAVIALGRLLERGVLVRVPNVPQQTTTRDLAPPDAEKS